MREGCPRLTGPEAPESFPWIVERLFGHRETLVLARLDDLPPEASRDRDALGGLGVTSAVAIPLAVGGEVIGALTLAAVSEARRWPRDLVDRLRLVAEIVASALVRQRVDTDLRASLAEIQRLRTALEAENRYLQEEIQEEQGAGELIGHSAALRAVLQLVDQVAATDVPVLLLGETGTGKEVVARAIRGGSVRVWQLMSR